MGRDCGCKGKVAKGAAAARKTYTVQLPGGTKLVKTSEVAAKSFVASHPGAKILP